MAPRQKTKGEIVETQTLARARSYAEAGDVVRTDELVAAAARLRVIFDQSRKIGEPGHEGRPPDVIDVVDRQATDGSRSTLPRNANHCTVCWLWHRKHINDFQHRAAETLQDLQILAGLTQIPSMMRAVEQMAELGVSIRGSRKNAEAITSDAIAAGGLLEGALASAGARGRFLLQKAVLEDVKLEDVAKLMGVKNRKAVLPMLHVALDALVTRFGLETVGPASASTRSWSHPFDGSI